MVREKKYVYQYSNLSIEEFVCALCPYLIASNCGSSGTGTSGYSGYSGGYSGIDGTGGCAIENITVAQGQSLISSEQVDPCVLYLVTNAYNNTAQIYLRGLSTSSFDEQGFGTFTNANTPLGVSAMLKYSIIYDKITEVYIPTRNVRVTQSYDPTNNTSRGNSIDQYPFSGNSFIPETNVDLRDTLFEGNVVDTSNFLFTDSIVINSHFVFNFNSAEFVNNYIHDALVIVNGQNTAIRSSSVHPGSIVFMGINGCQINDAIISQVSNVFVYNSSTINGLFIGEESTLILNGSNNFSTINIGQGKIVDVPVGYSTTNASIQDTESTFEVFINPNIVGVLDMSFYQFAGIIRIGQNSIPASWDLKSIQSFPTDHSFYIIPADSNTVDVYDAGVLGGNNIYLSTAAVVTYDGTKDNTLILRSGLNNSTRLFQIGGWIAPSA